MDLRTKLNMCIVMSSTALMLNNSTSSSAIHHLSPCHRKRIIFFTRMAAHSGHLCLSASRQTGKAIPRSSFNLTRWWPVRHALATFGTARLVKNPDGRHQLIGGTADDHAEAREWCSLFLHEAVFASVPRTVPLLAFAA